MLRLPSVLLDWPSLSVDLSPRKRRTSLKLGHRNTVSSLFRKKAQQILKTVGYSNYIIQYLPVYAIPDGTLTVWLWLGKHHGQKHFDKKHLFWLSHVPGDNNSDTT